MHGMTGKQIWALELKMRTHLVNGARESAAWDKTAREAAWRCAALLAANDVRGALIECDEWQFAQLMAQRQREWEVESDRRRERTRTSIANGDAVSSAKRTTSREVTRRADRVQKRSA